MKTVTRFDHLDDAYSAVAVLESEGVRCFLPDECTVGLYWPYCQAIGGIRLQVADDRFDQAAEILKHAPVDALSPMCPGCRSTNLRVMRFGKWSALAIGVGFCPPTSRVRYHCCACKKTFAVSEAVHDPDGHESLSKLALESQFDDVGSDEWPRYLRFPIGAVVGGIVFAAFLPVRALTATGDFPLATGFVVVGFVCGFCNLLIGLADDMRRRHAQPSATDNPDDAQ